MIMYSVTDSGISLGINCITWLCSPEACDNNNNNNYITIYKEK